MASTDKGGDQGEDRSLAFFGKGGLLADGHAAFA